MIALLLGGMGCSHVVPSAYVDRRMGEPLEVTPTPTSESSASRTAAHPEPFDSASPARGYAQDRLRAGGAESRETPTPPPLPSPARLSDLLELALSRDPATRAAWHEARAAAAAAGSRRAAYLPTLDATGRLQQQAAALTSTSGSNPYFASASGELTWLLLDLGARGALKEGAELELLAARLAHQAAALDLALSVQEAWFQYQTALALADASTSSVKEAETSLVAAEARLRAGVATVADVLQARTARSQATLDAQRLEGQVLALRGSLASLVGLPPTTPLEVVPLPSELPPDLALLGVERLLEEAAARNPELARARAQAGAAEARATAAARANLPTLSLSSSAGRAWPLDPAGRAIDAWSAGLVLSVPLLDGGRSRYDAEAAHEASLAALERTELVSRRTSLDVWTSLQALRTSGRRIESSRDLLASATASLEVVSARYRQGVGSILDLLGAQNSLALARAEEILARADWLVALARLARATGRALPPTDGASR